MTEEQKKQIIKLRKSGHGYGNIADLLGMSKNTVQAFCRRKGINGPLALKKPASNPDTGYCKNCGCIVVQNAGRKEKRFCSDRCRNQWWNANQDKVNKKAIYSFICEFCGKKFTAYGCSTRKFCSQDCYNQARSGGVASE